MPAASVDVAALVAAPALNVTGPPNGTLSMANWIEPVATPPALGATVAAKLTALPNTLGFCDDRSDVVVERSNVTLLSALVDARLALPAASCAARVAAT